MQAAMEAGITNPDKQRIVNQFCCHQQVLYISNVLDARGKCLNKRYLDRRKPNKLWLTLVFPQEKPPNKCLQLWQQVLYAIAPEVGFNIGLGAS
jgi:hypothetical protein